MILYLRHQDRLIMHLHNNSSRLYCTRITTFVMMRLHNSGSVATEPVIMNLIMKGSGSGMQNHVSD